MEPFTNSAYRSASPRALGATILLVAALLTDSLAALSTTGQIQLLDGALSGSPIPAPTAQARDARQCMIEIVSVGLWVAAYVAFLAWVYRANRNAHALCHDELEFSPGWSVGWFFVPIASLFMPYRVMAELWRANNPDTRDWRSSPVSPLLGIWWAVSVFGAVLHYSSWPIIQGKFRLADVEYIGSHWLDATASFYWGHLIAILVGIAQNVLTISVVVAITNLQQRKLASVTTEEARAVE